MPKTEEKAEIKKLVLSVGGRDIILRISEAKDLMKALNDIFGGSEEHHHHHHDSYPVYIERHRPYWDWNRPFYCSDTSKSMSFDNGILSVDVTDGSNMAVFDNSKSLAVDAGL